jgi:outer membrane protein
MRRTSLAGLALSAAATVAHAQQPAAAATGPRVAVIDVSRVYAESLLGKSYAGEIDKLEAEIRSEQTKKQAELQKLDASLRTLREEIEKQASVLSADALDRKRQDLTKKERDRQAYVEDGQGELARMQQRAQAQAEAYRNEFQTRIKPHIEAVAKDHGVDIILDSQVAITINKDFDLSRDVIVKADEAEKAKPTKPTLGAAAPPAAGKPLAAPTPAPTPKP